MAVRLRNAVDDRIAFMVVSGTTSKAEWLLDQTLGAPSPRRPTWKEIGEALGVSAQAAHRKYGEAARADERCGTKISPKGAVSRPGRHRGPRPSAPPRVRSPEGLSVL
jgi:hypothetical protein